MVVMAQLSPAHGWQAKYSLDFPGAPSGTIEYITLHALDAIAETGVKTITFGASAVNSFVPAHNLKGAGVKLLAKTYHAIATRLRLMEKGEFRGKLGAKEDPIYIAYPRHGLGPGGIKAIVSFMQED
jgi:ergosteryl-3beta-O-L-aspartate synthase